MNFLNVLNTSNSQRNEQTGEYILTVPILELENEYEICQEKDISLTSNCNTIIKCRKITITTKKQIVISNISFESLLIVRDSTEVIFSNCLITKINNDEYDDLLITNTQLASLSNIKIFSKSESSIICISNNSKVIITDLFLDNSANTLISINSSMFSIKDSIFTNYESSCITATNCCQIEIQNCKFTSIKSEAISFQNSSVKILNNVFQNVEYCGIVFHFRSTGLISQNQFKNIYGNAINLNNDCDVIIIDNDISHSTYPGIAVCNNCKALISKNNISNIDGNGISVRNASDVKITECKITEVGLCGISASKIKNCHINKNYIENCKVAAVEADIGSIINISDNTIVNIQEYAFYAYASAFIKAENNKINQIGKSFVKMIFEGGGEFVNNKIDNCPLQKEGQTSSQFFLSNNGNFKGITNIKSRQSNEVIYDDSIVLKTKCLKCNQRSCNAFLSECNHMPLCHECAWEAWAKHDNCPLCKWPITVAPKCTPSVYMDKSFKKKIQNAELLKIYSDYFDFTLFPFEVINNIEGQNLAESYLYGMLLDFKFIVYNFYKNNSNFEVDFNSKTQIANVVFCGENKCIIVEKVHVITIFKIVKSIEEQNISIFNTNQNIKNLTKTNENKNLDEEIDSFCVYFSRDINNNVFIKNTIHSIAGYLIQRFFYPTYYFNDPSFFNYLMPEKKNYTDNVKDMFDLFNYVIFSDEEPKDEFKSAFSNIEYICRNDDFQYQIHDFNENEFIILRKIYDDKASFYKVLHIESKYIFLMKKMHSKTYTNANKHEINFCSKYYCRCMVPFYGFLKEGNEIIGFIYEFMANDSLNEFVLKNNDKITEQYSLMTINRILQGIEYLQSKNLIYRDLKPANIFIDHDFIPYIADFETIRHPDEEMTNDIGSCLYTSPEQDIGEHVSYKTDIYSFGLVIYFIFEKKDMYGYMKPSFFFKSKSDKIFPIKNASKNINDIYKSCVDFDQNKRPSIEKIKYSLIKEDKLYKYVLNGKFDQIRKNNTYEISQYLYEFIFLKYSFQLSNGNSSIEISENSNEISENSNNGFSSLYFIEIKKQEELISINNQTKEIQTIYSQFNFFKINNIIDEIITYQNTFEKYLLDYFKDFKFFAYHISLNNDVSYESDSIANAYICVEGKCLIIENIQFKFISQVIKKLENYSSVLINANDSNINDDVLRFYSYFEKDIKESLFVQKTLKSISCFLIRRFFYPASFFKNKTFFYFDKNAKFKEDVYKAKIIDFIDLNHYFNPEEFVELICEMKHNKSEKKLFELSDFILLRKIHHSNNASFYLAFHIENLYIFCIVIPCDKISKNDIEFCISHSHRCFPCFYGFLQDDKKKVIGFVYEYMCNDTLESFIASKRQISDKYFMILINRIFQGIKYLHSKNFAFDDLKPSNILLDNNFIPYIFVYNTIYKINEEVKDDPFYSDIHSFGMIINFILEKNKKCIETNNNDKQIHFSSGFQNLYQSCTKISESKRPNKEEIFSCILNEFYLKFRKYYTKSITNDSEMIQFLFEFMNVIPFEGQELSKFFNYLTRLKGISQKKFFQNETEISNSLIDRNCSEVFYILGLIYQQATKPNILKSIKYYELAAQNKHINALCQLGDNYFNGNGIQCNYLKAKEYYELAAQNKCLYALCKLGDFYYYGFNVPVNYTKAKNYFETVIHYNKDNLYALCKLGDIYYNGFLGQKKCSKSKEYYELAAKNNNSYALYMLGEIYLNGKIVQINYQKAIKYYELSAQYKNPNALFKLSTIYYFGNYIEKNYSNAKKYFELLIQIDNSNEDKQYKIYKSYALYYLGEIYQHGYDVNPDISSAIKYYQASAQYNNPISFFNLGHIYEKGNGVIKDYIKAKECYEKVLQCTRNNLHENIINDELIKSIESKSLYRLGKFYEKGRIGKKNDLKAYDYYLQAAKYEYPNALYEIGIACYYGDVCKKNYVKCKEYLELAFNKGSLKASYCLGKIYELGKGVQKNIKKAIEYYSICENLDSYDLCFIGCMYEEGIGIQQNYKKAKEYYEKAAALENSAESFICIGFLYENGFGVEKNKGLAKLYYSQGAEINSNELICLGLLYEIGEFTEDCSGHYRKQNYYKSKIFYEYDIKNDENCNLYSYIYLGNLYLNGFGVEARDYLKAKELYEKSALMGEKDGLIALGSLYFYGLGVEKNYKKAFMYYTEAKSDLNLGFMYENGYGVDKDLLKAKSHYESGIINKNVIGYLFLGNLYRNGLGVKQDYNLAKYCYKKCYRISSEACFHIAYFYTSGEFFEIDEYKAMMYYNRCIKNHNKKIEIQEFFNDYMILGFIHKGFYYRACNGIGLLYITNKNMNLELAKKYFCEAGSCGYSYGKNNFGLCNEIYLNSIPNALQLYKEASKNGFALSEYNIGNIKEKEKNEITEKAIKHYIKASDNEDTPLVFFNYEHHDIRLEVSNYFIICFTNLKIVKYFCSKSNLTDAKKYFVRAFNKIMSNHFRFHFINEKGKNIFTYLKYYILLHPLFNLENQRDIDKVFNIKDLKYESNKFNFKLIDKKSKNDEKFNSQKDLVDFNKKKEKIKIKTELIEQLKPFKKDDNDNTNMNDTSNNLYNLYFNDPSQLFDFIVQNRNLLNEFYNEIEDIHNIIQKILYQPPYLILFGRISIEKPKLQKTSMNINQDFYDGLGLSEFKMKKEL